MTIETSPYQKYKQPFLVAREGMNGWCGIDKCNQPQLDSLPLCEDHAFDMWVEVGERMDAYKAAKAKARHEAYENSRTKIINDHLRIDEWRATRRQTPGLIYYLLIEDKVKIGYTTDLDVRLKAYPPMAKLLATHPGTRQTERDMHDKFSNHLAERKEWFHANEELDSHISQIHEKFKQDPRVIA